jgi:hypothetical protein
MPANFAFEFKLQKRAVMRKSATVLLASIILMGGNAALARDGSGGHHNGAGGMAPEHMGQRGSGNSNAQWAADATKGQERSEVRHHDQAGRSGAKDEHANHGKSKHKDHENGGKDKDKGGKHKGHQHKDHSAH